MGKNKLKDIIIEHESLPIVYNALSRRLFIKSSSGLLAIPLIAGLMPKQAWAALNDSENAYRKAVFMSNEDGGHLLDAVPTNVNYQQVAQGVRAGSLNNAQLGMIYNGSFHSLRNKLSIITGLTCAAAVNHCKSAAFASSYSGYAKSGKGDAVNGTFSNFPYSIDAVLGNKIYGSGQPQNLKVLRLGGSRSFGGAKKHDGTYTSISSISTSAARNLVAGQSGGGGGSTNPTPPTNGGPSDQDKENLKKRRILERTLASISSTKQNARVSAQARSRINDYQDLLSQIRDAIPEPGSSNNPAPQPPPQAAGSCGNLNLSSDGQKARADLIVAAFACGATRLATMSMSSNHTLAHKANSPGGRDSQTNFLRNTALPIGAYLIGLMDQVGESNGNTLLENSCVLMTSDNGTSSTSPHNGHSMRVLMAGGLNGKLRMGEAIDFSDRSGTFMLNSEINASSQGPRGGAGIDQVKYNQRPYNELLITIMRAFGLNQSDYSFGGRKGFGQYHIDEVAHKKLFDKKLINPSKPTAMPNRIQNYMKNFLRGYNKDSTLKYFLRG